MNNRLLYFKYALSTLVGLFMTTACVEEYEAELPETESCLLVVDGTICSNSYSLFNLTWSVPLSNRHERDYYHYSSSDYGSSSSDYFYSVEKYVSGATVTICGTDGSKYECPEVVNRYEQWYDDYVEYYGTGIYGCFTPELDPNVSYYVTIEYNGDTWQSTPEKPIRTPDIETLEYFQKDSLSNVEVLLTTAAPDDPDQMTYYTWNYGETWEVRPARETKIYFDLNTLTKQNLPDDQKYPERGWKYGHDETILTASSAHYDGGKFTRYQLLEIPRDDERVSWYYCNDVTQRAISKAEYEYDMACIQAGWEMGGLFSPQPSALPTNIRCLTSSNRAIGYVGCSLNVVRKRMYIDGTQISRILPEPGPLKIFDSCSEIDCIKMVQNGWVLYLWYDGRMIGDPLSTYWAYPVDFDVRLKGASVFKPDYMPPFEEN